MAQVFQPSLQKEIMRVWVIGGLFFLLSCGSAPEGTSTASQTTDSTTATTIKTSATDSSNAPATDTTNEAVPVVQTIKRPSGVYQFLLPGEKGEQVLHTIAFYPNRFRLQEEYGSKRDSVVVTEGNWSPSEGFIWLYRDQIVRGRYTWKGDTLQYFSPRLKKSFSLEKLTPATANEVWQTKKREGSLLYGVGTEPFWSIEINNQDTIVLNMPDWESPLRAKMTATDITKDSTVYAAGADSVSVTVYPYFCNDGMSETLYTRRVKVVYKGQTYRGCGETFRAAH